MSESELDKKRNKLGYQRISIACGKYLRLQPMLARHVAIRAALARAS